MKAKKIYLVENYRLSIKEAYSNLSKVHRKYSWDYSTMWKGINRCGEYRNKDYIVTKLIVL